MNELLKQKSDITAWLDCHGVKAYTLRPDSKYGYVVDVASDVDFVEHNLDSIEVKFNQIHGEFNCSKNKLKSLAGAPDFVSRSFVCSDNQLVNLHFCPQLIGNNFYCTHNQLSSLKGCPQTVSGNFSCNDNLLTSLEGCPQVVGEIFACKRNSLTSLEFCPKVVRGNFLCRDNPGLGQLQQTMDFEQIYKAHLVFENIKKEKKALQKSIKSIKKEPSKIHKI